MFHRVLIFMICDASPSRVGLELPESLYHLVEELYSKNRMVEFRVGGASRGEPDPTWRLPGVPRQPQALRLANDVFNPVVASFRGRVRSEASR